MRLRRGTDDGSEWVSRVCFEYVFRLCRPMRRKGVEIVCLVKPQTGTIFPLGASAADLAGGDSRSSETEVCGSGNGNTHTRFDKAAHHRIWLMPFLREECRKLPKEESCLSSQKSVGRNQERSE
jgi:hypothetical protein